MDQISKYYSKSNKTFKENIRLNLYNLELGNGSLNIKSKAQETKEKR